MEDECKRDRCYQAYRFGILLVGIFFAADLVYCFVVGHSMAWQLFVSCFHQEQWLSRLAEWISPEAIRVTAQTIGLGGFLLIWLYSSLDRKELGICYGTLLTDRYKGFHTLMLAHYIAILGAIWLSFLEKREPALLALIVVMLGVVIQWRALLKFVLSPPRRRRVAVSYWKKKIKDLEQDLQKQTDKETREAQFLGLLYSLADEISPIETENRDRPEILLLNAADRYITVRIKNKNSGDPFREYGRDQKETERFDTVLEDMVQLWGYYLNEKGEEESYYMVRSAMITMNSSKGHGTTENKIGYADVIVMAYLLYRYRLCILKCRSTEDIRQKAIDKLARETELLSASIREEGSELITLFHMGIAMLMWTGFLLQQVTLDVRACCDMPKDFVDRRTRYQCLLNCVGKLAFEESRAEEREMAIYQILEQDQTGKD